MDGFKAVEHAISRPSGQHKRDLLAALRECLEQSVKVGERVISEQSFRDSTPIGHESRINLGQAEGIGAETDDESHLSNDGSSRTEDFGIRTAPNLSDAARLRVTKLYNTKKHAIERVKHQLGLLISNPKIEFSESSNIKLGERFTKRDWQILIDGFVNTTDHMIDRMAKVRGDITEAATMVSLPPGIPGLVERQLEGFFNVCPFPNDADMSTIAEAFGLLDQDVVEIYFLMKQRRMDSHFRAEELCLAKSKTVFEQRLKQIREECFRHNSSRRAGFFGWSVNGGPRKTVESMNDDEGSNSHDLEDDMSTDSDVSKSDEAE